MSYPSDLTDRQWSIIEPLIPPAEPGGRDRTVDMREVINGTLYLNRTGCSRRMLPHEFPLWDTVHDYCHRFQLGGSWQRIHDKLREKVRRQAGKKPTSTAAIIDSQTVKTDAPKRGRPRLRRGQENSRAQAPSDRGHARAQSWRFKLQNPHSL